MTYGLIASNLVNQARSDQAVMATLCDSSKSQAAAPFKAPHPTPSTVANNSPQKLVAAYTGDAGRQHGPGEKVKGPWCERGSKKI